MHNSVKRFLSIPNSPSENRYQQAISKSVVQAKTSVAFFLSIVDYVTRASNQNVFILFPCFNNCWIMAFNILIGVVHTQWNTFIPWNIVFRHCSANGSENVFSINFPGLAHIEKLGDDFVLIHTKDPNGQGVHFSSPWLLLPSVAVLKQLVFI